MQTDTRHRSRTFLEGRDGGGARAMLRAIGFDEDDLAKPIVGVAHTWIETMPCNFNQRRLAERVKAGVRAAGGTPDRKSTRLNSSHANISYAVFCLKKKKN